MSIAFTSECFVKVPALSTVTVLLSGLAAEILSHTQVKITYQGQDCDSRGLVIPSTTGAHPDLELAWVYLTSVS